MTTTAIVWYRRDLRTHDHPALTLATQTHSYVFPLFVLDNRFAKCHGTKRFQFLIGCLQVLNEELQRLGSFLTIKSGSAELVVPAFARELGAETVFWTSDVSPIALQRDRNVQATLKRYGIDGKPQAGNYGVDISKLQTTKGRPFTVFTPFWKQWQLAPRRPVLLQPTHIKTPNVVGSQPALPHLTRGNKGLSLIPGEKAAKAALTAWVKQGVDRYEETRNFPAADGTSNLSTYLRWGCISTRVCEEAAKEKDHDWVRQLCWRDFYAHILLFFPETIHTEFQERYRKLEWEQNSEHLTAWQQGKTGYPLIDAGMRQLAKTGWMHNRVRMVVGSFLTKTLHLDWRHGERWFANQLLDFDPAQNCGNWQWIASVGVDPAPYFQRMFNPVLQQQKFDPEGIYVKHWVPELKEVSMQHLAEPWKMSSNQQQQAQCEIGRDYPHPIVEHQIERQHAMVRYRAVKQT